MEKIVLQKEIDISVLRQGFTVPRETTEIFGFFDGSYLLPGESKQITIVLNNYPYKVQVRNTLLNDQNRLIHPNDTIQVRYNEQSDFAHALRAIFNSSWQFLQSEWEKKRESGDRTRIVLPQEMKEYLVIYGTEKEDIFVAEPILMADFTEIRHVLTPFQELQVESLLENSITDPTSRIEERLALTKFRKLDSSISTQLKELYNYRCQICGEPIGLPYGIHTCECHHIDYFSKSWNNDMSNQMIVCPNHHRAIHSANPLFNRKLLQYEFKNGFIEKLMLNKHLSAS